MQEATPVPILDPSQTATLESHLATLDNDTSTYLQICKSCLYFNQMNFPIKDKHTTSSIIKIISSLQKYNTDRRCRILLLHTLSQFCQKLGDTNQDVRIQDEIMDVSLYLLQIGLEDDNGVSSEAMVALSSLLSTDLKQKMLQGLQSRFYKLLNRTHYMSHKYQLKYIGILHEIILYSIQSNHGSVGRWYEESSQFMEEYVNHVLIPNVHYSMVAMYSLEFIERLPVDAIWSHKLYLLSIHTLYNALESLDGPMQEQTAVVKTLFQALTLENLHVEDTLKIQILEHALNFVSELPSTTLDSNQKERVPLRLGFISDIAMIFCKDMSLDAISIFLLSNTVKNIISKNYTLGHEFIYSFCSIAYTIGNSLTKKKLTPKDMEYRDNWCAMSLVLLQSFMPCLLWTDSLGIRESTLFAAQRSYVQVLHSMLLLQGSLPRSNSIYHHFILSENQSDNANLSNMDGVMNNSTLMNRIRILLDKIVIEISNSSAVLHIRLSLLCILTDAWICHCQSLIQGENLITLSQSGPIDVDHDIVNLNERHAQNLVSALGSEISKLIVEEKQRNPKQASTQSGIALRSLLASISSVESIGYIAQLCANYFSTQKESVDEEESASYLVSICTLILKGQGKVEEVDGEADHVEHKADSPSRSPRSKARITAFTSECSNAASRLRNFAGINDGDVEPETFDFNCLCPLLKRKSFGSVSDHTVEWENQSSHANMNWFLDDCFPIVGTSTSILQDYDIVKCFFSDISTMESEVIDRILYLQQCRDEISNACTKISRQEERSKHDGRNGKTINHIIGVKSVDLVGCSEPISCIASASTRIHKRLKNHQEKFIFLLKVQVTNVTPVTIDNHLQLMISMSLKKNRVSMKKELPSLTIVDYVYTEPLESGDSFSWEVEVKPTEVDAYEIRSSITVIGVDKENVNGSSLKQNVKLQNGILLNELFPEVHMRKNLQVYSMNDNFDLRSFIAVWQSLRATTTLNIDDEEELKRLIPDLDKEEANTIRVGTVEVKVHSFRDYSVVICPGPSSMFEVFIRASDEHLLKEITDRPGVTSCLLTNYMI